MGNDGSGVVGRPAKMTYREAAISILRDRGPLHYQVLADAIAQAGLVRIAGATPAASLNATIAVDIKRKGRKSAFVRVRPGVFGLRELQEETNEAPLGDASSSDALAEAGSEDTDLRVRVPYFPVYSEVRHLLRVWPGRPRKQVTGLRATIIELRGTRKSAVNWTDPATWVPERLKGSDRKLAQAIWEQSKGAVNPRHIYGHWLLAQRYGLLREDNDGLLEITKTGHNFLETSGGEAESVIDEAEGLSKLLSIVADSGPARAGGLVEEWADYLTRRSAIRTESMIKDTLRRRLTEPHCPRSN